MTMNLSEVYNILERIDDTFRNYMMLNEELILEAASLTDVYQKYYNQIPEEEFRQIVAADPTAGEDKMGKYSKWLLALYTGGNLKLEDLYKATQYLTTFHKYKNKLDKKDIGQYKSLPDLFNSVNPYLDNTKAASHKEEIRQIKKDAEKVYEDDEWLVIVPHTEEAAVEYGKGTQWCTAATGSWNYFDAYNDEGFLYININKKTGRKYQFHFESQSFMDETDSSVELDDIGLSKELEKFYENRYGLLASGTVERREGTNYFIFWDAAAKFTVDLKGQWIDGEEGYTYMDFVNEETGCSIVGRDLKMNVLDINGKLISPDLWFDKVEDSDFCDEWFVTLDGKVNILKMNGELLSKDMWFDEMDQLFDNFTRVRIGDKENVLNPFGNLISSDLWFKHAGCPYENAVVVQTFDGKYCIFDIDLKEITSEKYDHIQDFSSGFAKVMHNNQFNLLTPDGCLLSEDMWFDEIGTLLRQLIRVIKNGKYNLLSKDGYIISPHLWFDKIGYWYSRGGIDNMGYAIVINGTKENIIFCDGRLMSSKQWFDGCSYDSTHDIFIGFLRNKNNKLTLKKEFRVVNNKIEELKN